MELFSGVESNSVLVKGIGTIVLYGCVPKREEKSRDEFNVRCCVFCLHY